MTKTQNGEQYTMKNMIKKLGILGQIMLFASPIPAMSATIDLTVSTFGSRNCGPGDSKIVTYEVTGQTPSGSPQGPTYEQPLTVVTGENSCSGAVRAYGQTGVLGVQGNITNTGQPTGVFTDTNLIETDIRVVPIFGQTYTDLRDIYGPDISIRPNIDIAGEVYASDPFANATLNVTGFVGGTDSAGQPQLEGVRAAILTGGATGSSGVPISFQPGSFAFTEGITIDPLQPISIQFVLNGIASASGNFGIINEAYFESFNSLSFSPDGPAFDVPDGFTVEAPSLGIFDNQWIDPRIAVDPQPSAVPLPAGGFLLLSGLLGIAVLNRRKRYDAKS